MDIYKQKLTSLSGKIFSLLCLRAGERLSQREIAGLLGVSPTAVARPIASLEKAGLVRLEATKTINFISFNPEESRAVEQKRVENLRNLYLSGLADYLGQTLSGATLVLFGSFSRGEDTATSDIDIAVVGRKDKPMQLEPYEKALHRSINLSFHSSWKGIDIHVRNNILNGIVLKGTVEL